MKNYPGRSFCEARSFLSKAWGMVLMDNRSP